jgi:hypothetical protein
MLPIFLRGLARRFALSSGHFETEKRTKASRTNSPRMPDSYVGSPLPAKIEQI